MTSTLRVFSVDWFTTHIPKWERILAPHIAAENQLVLEIGSLEGRSALWFLEKVIKQSGRLWCVDSWIPYPEFPDMSSLNWEEIEGTFDNNVKGHGGRLTKMKASSAEALPYLLVARKRPFNIVYVDGSHLTKNCLRDMVFGWSMLAVGGTMIVDDYTWDTDHSCLCPKLAADAFLVCYEGFYEILDQDVQLILKKIVEDE